MRKFVLVLLVITLAACVSPRPPRRVLPVYRAHLPYVQYQPPLIPQPVAPWPWPRWGYGRPTQHAVSDVALRQGITSFWWHDWGAHCYDKFQVPMVWRDVTSSLWACNDGRPVLILNEPDVVGQADLTPAAAADRLYQVVAGGWAGEVWCCGTEAWHLDYADAIIDSYTSRYGPWPATGWHVHVYVNQAVWVRDLQDSKKYVGRSFVDLDTFISHMQERGVLGRGIVLSEYGALSAWWPSIQLWHSPAMLVPTFDAYAAGIRARPVVLGAAWFSSYYQSLSASDLLWADGSLTELGQAWRLLPR